MKIKHLMIALLLMMYVGTNDALAQKKPLDHDVYDSWQSVSGVKMSDDGKVLVWNVNPQEGDGSTEYQSLIVKTDNAFRFFHRIRF